MRSLIGFPMRLYISCIRLRRIQREPRNSGVTTSPTIGKREILNSNFFFASSLRDGAHQDQLLNALGIIKGQRRGNCAAIRSPDDRGAPNSQPVHQTLYRVGLLVNRVARVARLVGIPITRQVRRDHPESGIRQRAQDMAPEQIRRNEAMDQDERRRIFIAGFPGSECARHRRG